MLGYRVYMSAALQVRILASITTSLDFFFLLQELFGAGYIYLSLSLSLFFALGLFSLALQTAKKPPLETLDRKDRAL